MMVQRLLEKVCRPTVHNQHTLSFALLPSFLVGEFALPNLDVIFSRQPPQCLGISHLFVLHDEAHGRASLAAAEAMAHPPCGRHHERGRLFVVKGAQPLIVGSGFSKRYEFGHHIHDVGSLFNLFYGSLVDHQLSCLVIAQRPFSALPHSAFR